MKGAIFLTVLLLAACTSSQSPPEPAPTRTIAPQFNQAIADLVPEQIKRDGELRVGTDPSYPPMEFFTDDGGSVQGFDIDLASGIATVMGLTPDFAAQAYSRIPQGVRTGRVELGIASLSIPDPEELTTFAVTYYESGNQLVARESIQSLQPNNVCGFVVAVQEGSVQVEHLSQQAKQCRQTGQPPLTIMALSSQDDVTAAVLAGDAEGFLADVPAALWATRTNDGIELRGEPTQPAPLGMLTNRSYKKFAKAVQLATQDLIDSGYYEQLLTDWKIPEGRITKAKILRP